MKTTLLIMAAGLGSRFGEGIKQLSKIDRDGHIIIDYSVHDAIAAGFDKIVFIIRKEIAADFFQVIGNRIEAVCRRHGVAVAYAYQSLTDIPAELPAGRTKPWGTGQAVLAAKNEVDGPFAVINADDYYGKHAFELLHKALTEETEHYLVGFRLKNTLSDNGCVTRGVCKIEGGMLTGITETRNIVKTPQGAEAEGKILAPDTVVSMNMWGFRPDFLNVLSAGFESFFREEQREDPLKSEFLIPVFVGKLLQAGSLKVCVAESGDTWYGMTYREDVPAVQKNFQALLDAGVYRSDLFSDL